MLLLILGAGLLMYVKYKDTLNEWSTDRLPRYIRGEIFGSYPAPTQPTLQESVTETVSPKARKKAQAKMVVQRLPTIPRNAKLPHPYWGPCVKCHLIRGGAPPGSQPITPVGKVLEQASTLHKIGPPIRPDSTRRHPAAGRCIKCHDIVVSMPVPK
ncbi:magnetosome protein MamT [Magnetofaba australis]|uniref:magnetosome protein MamT n=1 Tax=Magnetofaba australis TaxID=1472297 RepID=UPI00117BE45A|nr:magnetosome protein MamT [Magnetofaba australis]